MPSWAGVPHLHLIAGPGVPPQEPVAAGDLLLPVQGGRVIPASPYLIPKGRNDSLLHLGADYLVFDDPLLIPSHPDAILVAAAYLTRGTYMAIALDLSGDTQFYLVTSNPSDLHIAAISVEALYRATGEDDLPAALRVLFSGALERTVGQYPELFLPPDSVLVALQAIEPP